MTLELGVDAGRQVVLDEISEEGDDIVAAAFLSHERLQFRFRIRASSTLTQKPGNLKLKPLTPAVGRTQKS